MSEVRPYPALSEGLRVSRDIWTQVEAVLHSGTKLALATTGGGSELISWLLNHPGASCAIVEAQVPYSERALAAYLAAPGPHRASEQTARDLAGRAFVRAASLAERGQCCIGVGCSAALATNRPRRGPDRGCLALRLAGSYRLYTLHFEKGAADRLAQEEVLSRLALEALVEAGGGPVAGGSRPEYAHLTRRVLALDDPLSLLFAGELDVVETRSDGGFAPEVERGQRLLLSGSFNPLHEGHERLAVAAGQLSGRQPSLELSIENVDKPPLQRSAVESRLAQMRGRFPVVVTRSPTFLQKARLFGGCHFVLGYDTAVRLLQGQYYDDGERGLAAALAELAAEGCRFWVAGRADGDAYHTLADIDVPAEYADLFAPVPFRMDISSTELRARG